MTEHITLHYREPVYLGRRTDAEARDCHRSQLKFKPSLAA